MKKTQIVIIALALALSLGGITMLEKGHDFSREEQVIFVNWMKENSKSYGTSNELKFRRKTFIKTLREIKKVNARQDSFKFGLNQFSDMTLEEKKIKLTGSLIPQPEERKYMQLKSNRAPPLSIDYREKGLVTPVKNQEACGACWAFSVAQAIEGWYAAQEGNNLTQLSPGQLNQCATSYGNYGCRGGWMDKAFQYAVDKGMTTEEQYPFVPMDGDCQYDQTMKFTDVPSWSWVRPDEAALKMAVGNVGVVSIGLYADSIFSYKKGIYNDFSACNGSMDHAILAVGYGVTSDGKKFWIAKNSWGTGWGEDGYIRFARKDKGKGICGLTSYSTMVDDE